MASKDKVLAYIEEHKRMLRKVYHGLDYFCFSGITSEMFNILFQQSVELNAQQLLISDTHTLVHSGAVKEVLSKVAAGYLSTAARDKIETDISVLSKSNIDKMDIRYIETIFFNILWLFYKYELDKKELDDIKDDGFDLPNLSNLLPLSHLRTIFDKIDHDL